MSWNHRIVHDENGYSVREVFYEGKKVAGYTEAPNEVTGETLEELRHYYDQMKEAFEHDVIEDDHLEKEVLRYISHIHCWNQKQPPACGIPLEKHEQCCLCDLIPPRK